MKTWTAAIVAAALMIVPAAAQATQDKGDDVSNHIIMAVGPEAWNNWGGNAAIHAAEVQGGQAKRITVPKGDNP